MHTQSEAYAPFPVGSSVGEEAQVQARRSQGRDGCQTTNGRYPSGSDVRGFSTAWRPAGFAFASVSAASCVAGAFPQVKSEPHDSVRVKREPNQRKNTKGNGRNSGPAQGNRQNRNQSNRNQPRFLVSGEVRFVWWK